MLVICMNTTQLSGDQYTYNTEKNVIVISDRVSIGLIFHIQKMLE